MSMYTRCPRCETVFRVTPQQLRVSSGQVRCGKCQEVFDAFAALSSQLPAPAARAERDLPRPQPSAPGTEASPGRRQPAPAPATGGPEPARWPPVDGSAATQGSRAQPAVLEDVAPLTLPDELFGGAPAGAGRWQWSAASLALLALLAAQAAWFFPGELAARMPAAAEPLRQFCLWTGCQIALPRLPEQLFIEASDLQLLDPARPSEVLLTATIRNRGRLTQAFPLVELTLTNQVNATTARKVFAPEAYLERSTDQAQGLRANEEVSLRLYLDTGAIKPAGYRLYLFYV